MGRESRFRQISFCLSKPNNRNEGEAKRSPNPNQHFFAAILLGGSNVATTCSIHVAMDGVNAGAELLALLHDVLGVSGGFRGLFKRDCTDLVRRIALLTHLFEEIRDFGGAGLRPLDVSTSSASPLISLPEVANALQAAKRLLSAAGDFSSDAFSVSSYSYFVVSLCSGIVKILFL